MTTTPLLSQFDLRLLRAVDDRPGVIAEVYARMTGHGELGIRCSLAVLEGYDFVTATTIARTGATSYRVTRKGSEQLIATPPRRLLAGPRRGRDQLDIFAVSR